MDIDFDIMDIRLCMELQGKKTLSCDYTYTGWEWDVE